MKVASRLLLFFLLLGSFTSCEKENDCDRPSACELNPNPGPCLAAIPKYYYDRQAGECKEFTWGGCGGVVPFDTMEDCQACKCEDE